MNNVIALWYLELLGGGEAQVRTDGRMDAWAIEQVVIGE